MLNVIHSRCFSKSNVKQANEKYYCDICHSSILFHYNSFKKLNDEINSDSEQTFNEINVKILNLNMSLSYSKTTKRTLTLTSTTSMEINRILMFSLQN